MTTFQAITVILPVVAYVAALFIVACWPNVRGKGWLLGALTLACTVGIYSVGMRFGRQSYGREVFHGWRYVSVAMQWLRMIEVGLFAMAVYQLREFLNGKTQAKLDLSRMLSQSATFASALTIFIGMALPWAHMNRRWVPGWSTTANLFGLELPGYLLFIATATAVAILCYRAANDKEGIAVLPVVLCIYGVLHSIFMGFALLNTPAMEMGAGVIVTVAGFAALSFCGASRKTTTVSGDNEHFGDASLRTA